MQPFAADLAGSPPVGSPQWWKRPERFDLTGDSDADTARIVGIMCQHIKGGAQDAAVQHYAQEAARQFAGIAAVDGPGALAACAWWWCKTYLKFVHHEKLLRKHLGEAGHLQGLISPDALVRMSKPQGDCAIFTDCLCAFLRVFGVPYEIVTLAVNPREPQEYSHVFCYAVLPDGVRLPLDASHGDYPGWQVPSSDVFRRQVWDEDGNPVADRGNRFDGLHGYGLRGWGLGDFCDDYPDECGQAPVDPSISPAPTTGPYILPYPSGTPWPTDPTGAALPSTKTITVPPANTTQYAALIAQLAKTGMTLAQQQNLKPGMVINPSGQMLYQSPGYSINPGSGVQVSGPFGSSASASFSSMLPYALGLGALVLVASSFGGRR